MKTWFDVSGIYDWQGNFTGIQRIVYNLAVELNGSDYETGFFTYGMGVFSEISFIALEQRLKLLRSYDTKDSEELYKKKISFSKVQHNTLVLLKDTARNTRIEPMLRSTYVNSRGLYRGLKSMKNRTKQKNIFHSGDTVIVVDGNWQFNGYAEAIRSAKLKNKFKLVHFVHDLAAVKNPALASPGADKIIAEYFIKIFDFSDLLITISNSTKNDTEWFIKEYGITNKPKIETLIMGDNISTSDIQPIKPNKQIPPNYILAVSTIEVRKNYLSLYYAYKLAGQRGVVMPHLIIVGKRGWMAEEVYALLTEDKEIKAQVTILHGISDGELEWLYKNCMFTVFPSFYEGWGLPITESFARGKCCICSNTSSMPEAGGSLATYVSPYNTEELLSAIVRLSTKPELRKEIELRIKSEYKTQTWQQVFRQLDNLLTDI